eukprot:9491034-Pyramimonas_sp.AAC.1
MKAGGLLLGRSILRIIQTHVTTREDHGQAYTYEDLMAVQFKGEGKEADRDLYHFYDEWTRVALEMEKPHKSVRPSIQTISLYAASDVARSTWFKPIPTRTWRRKIGTGMSESDRLFGDVEYLVSSDSTISLISNMGSPALQAALLQELQNRPTSTSAMIQNGATLDDIRANLRSMNWTPPPGSCNTCPRVMIWSGDELCVRGEGSQRRVKGARREDTPSDYDDVERDALSMIDDVVDEQAYTANAMGEMLVFLARGDGESWNQVKTSSDCTIWDNLASR